MRARSRAKSSWRKQVRNREPGAESQEEKIKYKQIGHHQKTKQSESKASSGGERWQME
jgi:hypothetical protein